MTLPRDSVSEGDVETKVVVQLLTRAELLNISVADIRSKEGLVARDIGKGSKRKIGYIPDFCVYKMSLPVLVVEAKSPSNDVSQAYSEARLYASEINRAFPTTVNPCSRLLATNGTVLLAGYWDTDPQITAQVIDLRPGSKVLDDLARLLGNDELQRTAEIASLSLKAPDFSRAANQGVAQVQVASKIDPNSFSADLSPVLRRYFSSRSQTDDFEIFSRGYISSDEVTSYDGILESFLKDRLSRSRRRTEIRTSRKKSELITKTLSKYDEQRPQSGDLQLITGSVGVGKSLFARRYKEYLQPEPLRKKNHWAFINFINPPEDRNKWNDWICEGFCKSIIKEGAPVNLQDEADQERVFASNIAERSPYYARVERVRPGDGELEKARDIEEWRVNPLKLTRGIARFLQGDRNDNIIVVFDNVDRREAIAQLSAFQAALWFMEETKCLVLLQMRDSTFEAFKNEPPLDTYKTGQIFHISPPRFVDVVKKRLELSLEALSGEVPERMSFTTRSGIKISYPKSRAGEFLKGIYFELFEKRNNVARILEALAGRNVRRALDMFLAIITSGHVPEDVIASVAQGVGFRPFPEHFILRALMRQDYRFFNNNSGFVANIFHCEPSWRRPSNLLIPELLYHLVDCRKSTGDNGQLGYVSLTSLLSELEVIGFVRSDVRDATQFCLAKELLEVETSSTDTIRDSDCVKATANGWAHMRLLSARVEYLSSLLPTTAVDDAQLRSRVFDLMQTESFHGTILFHQAVGVVENFAAYLIRQSERMAAFPGFVEREQSGTRYVINKVQEAVRFARSEAAQLSKNGDVFDF